MFKRKNIEAAENPHKIKLTRGDLIFRIFVYAISALWVIAGLFPAYWMLISSTKDQIQALQKPPSFIPQVPYEYVVETEVPDDYSLEEFEYDATLILFMCAERFNDVSAGIFSLQAVNGDRVVASAEMNFIDFKNNRDLIFFGAVTENQLKFEETYEAAFNVIKDTVKFGNVSAKRVNKENKYVDKINTFLMQSTDPDNSAELPNRVRMTTLNCSISGCHSKVNMSAFFNNFRVAWNYFVPIHSMTFDRFLLNSLFVSVMNTLITCLTCGLAGFCFSKMLSKKVRNALMLVYIATMMIPGIVSTIPMYLMMQKLNLINSYWSLLLPAMCNVVAIFLFTGFFDELPKEMYEAAKIDGAGYLEMFVRMTVPLSAPVFTILAIQSFVGSWNDYFWPYMMLKDVKKWTFPVVVKELSNLSSGGKPDYTIGLALSVIATIPTMFIFLFFQNQLTKGIAFTGLKG